MLKDTYWDVGRGGSEKTSRRLKQEKDTHSTLVKKEDVISLRGYLAAPSEEREKHSFLSAAAQLRRGSAAQKVKQEDGGSASPVTRHSLTATDTAVQKHSVGGREGGGGDTITGAC